MKRLIAILFLSAGALAQERVTVFADHPGLARDDFQLFVAGEQREITSFSSRVREPRKFIFYFDRMSIADAAAQQLLAQLDAMMRDGDEAALFQPMLRKNELAFTKDRDAIRGMLRQALDRESMSPMQYELLELHTDTRAAARRFSSIVRMRVQQRLGQLLSLVSATHDAVVVVITESLPLEPGREAFASFTDGNSILRAADGAYSDWNLTAEAATFDWLDLTPLVEEIVLTAAGNGVVIVPMQPARAAEIFEPNHNVRVVRGRRDAERPSRAMLEQIDANTARTLRLLATGDPRAAYILGFDAGDAVDRPRDVQVRVKGRPDVQVRAQSQVIRKSPAREMSERVMAALIVAEKSNDLQIELSSKVVAGVTEIDVHVPDAAENPCYTIHFAALGEDFLSGSKETNEATTTLPLHLQPGNHKIVVGVRDCKSGKTGFASMTN